MACIILDKAKDLAMYRGCPEIGIGIDLNDDLA